MGTKNPRHRNNRLSSVEGMSDEGSWFEGTADVSLQGEVDKPKFREQRGVGWLPVRLETARQDELAAKNSYGDGNSGITTCA